VWYEEVKNKEFVNERMLGKFKDLKKANKFAEKKAKQLKAEFSPWEEMRGISITPSQNYY